MLKKSLAICIALILIPMFLLTGCPNGGGVNGSSGGADGGADGGDGGNGGNEATQCTLTLSGAISASGPCRFAMAFDGNNQTTGINLVGELSNPEGITFALALPAEPATETYSSPSSYKVAAVIQQNQSGSGPIWEMSQDQSNSSSLGSFSLTISQLGNVLTDGNNSKVWQNTHGSLSFTAEPIQQTGAAGSVQVQATF